MAIDKRKNDITRWLEKILNSTEFRLNPASSDASFRRYFRVSLDNKTWIVMDAPPEFEDTQPFITIATFLKNNNINVPEIIAQDSKQGFLLLTDFGSTAYLDTLNELSVDKLYQDAMNSLINIQSISQTAIILPKYDEALLRNELNLFSEWFLQRHLNISLPECLPSLFSTLISNAINQPQVIVHRDYHSRNLMKTAQHSPGIIDFQDAVIGPISYDLVSLLRDCYIAWPQHRIEQWIDYYLTQAQSKGLLTDISHSQFSKWFDLMGLQRHIKVLGIFCRLNYRDNKTNYMANLAQTLEYVRVISARYEDLSEFNTFISNHPKLINQL